MTLLPSNSTRPYSLLPYTMLVRSASFSVAASASQSTSPSSSIIPPSSSPSSSISPIAFQSPQPSISAPASPSSSQVPPSGNGSPRSEEHTSELQSLMRISTAVFCLKKKK